MIMYHVTPRKNVHSIIVEGLIPQRGDGLTNRAWLLHEHIRGHVFFTDNPDYILEEQGGDIWNREQDPMVLEVNVEGLDLKLFRVWSTEDEPEPHEWVFKGTVPPDRIVSVLERDGLPK